MATETKTTLEVKPTAHGDTLSGQQSAEYKENIAGVGVKLSVSASGKLSTETRLENGNLSWTGTAEVSATTKGEVKGEKVGVGMEERQGLRSTYNVVVPEKALADRDPATITPYDPVSMPVGTKVSIDSANFEKSKLTGTFDHLAIESRVSTERGSGVLVEKTSDHMVRVMAGPKDALEKYDGIGVEFGKARALLGREDKLEGKQLQTAEFDLSTPQGQGAYNRFLGLGVLPKESGPGVSNVSTVETHDLSSASQLGITLGKFEKSIDLQKNTGELVVTKRPDGSTESSALKIHYDTGVPLAIESTFDKDGHEVVSARRYTLTFDANENSCPSLNNLPLERAGADTPIKPGDKVTLTLTEEQMQKLASDTQQANPRPSDANFWVERRANLDEGSDPSQAFALKMAATQGNQVRVLEALQRIYPNDPSHPQQTLPGTLQVQGKTPDLQHDQEGPSHGGPSGVRAQQSVPLDDPSHPGYKLFTQVRDYVHEMDTRYRKSPDVQSDNLSGVLTVAAKANGITHVGGVEPNTKDASTVFVYGTATSAGAHRYAEVPTVQALNTPLATSSEQYHQAGVKPSLAETPEQAQQQAVAQSPLMGR
ncbi:XVIPCD domain-containing protein [Xanthomonas sp. NCPPB 2632]|uniref:XVIPCD domain-containing protein n=1 Tax=Xanthomonas sp. NCPPB 2632 TaxID=3240912 RepID=UPI0035121A9B